MIPIYRMAVIQIEITNACHLQCANCTRFVGHHKKPYMMDEETVAKSIDSLEGFPGNIGMMGGEPPVHPKFEQLCKIYQEKIPDKSKRSLWTAGYKWDEYKEIREETFPAENVLYNDHPEDKQGVHQPLLLAADDLMEDKSLMWRLIGSCWIQWRWSASITPKGAFFCEVAAAMDMLFDGPGGYPIEKGWWKRTPAEFDDQVRRYCPMCSAAIPMERPDNKTPYDLVSPSNAKRLEAAQSRKFKHGNIEIIDKKLTEKDIYEVVKKGWYPWEHRNFKQSAPDVIWE